MVDGICMEIVFLNYLEDAPLDKNMSVPIKKRTFVHIQIIVSLWRKQCNRITSR